jgi:hypothetical protein
MCADVSTFCQNNHFALAYLTSQPTEDVVPSGAAGSGPALPEVVAPGKAKKKKKA